VRVSDFHFDLPEDLIAQTPPAVRGSSRMLRVDRSTGAVADDVFASLPRHLSAGDLLILNDSRVIPARLYAVRRGLATQAGSPAPSGRVEVLLTQQLGAHDWSALVRPGRKVQPGETLSFPGPDGQPVLEAEVLTSGEYGERTLRFAPDPAFLEKLDRIGHMPLPPYIHRPKDQPDSTDDKTRYQTVYAAQPGSAAAPTAGLHFTPEILAQLHQNGVQVETVTLHVGLGTFQPVRAERLEDIRLHTEHYTLPAATASAINSALADGRRIVAAGTTTTRTLEHCAAIALAAPGLASETLVPALEPHSGSTSIFLSPGHRFRVSGLLTNFHLPESTLLMLVSAFLGEADEGRDRALAAYAHAVRERYRFFSYGDCMLIL
jgi:S-adenosylmethionine:tRNA ribosyltransferase-isomerase